MRSFEEFLLEADPREPAANADTMQTPMQTPNAEPEPQAAPPQENPPEEDKPEDLDAGEDKPPKVPSIEVPTVNVWDALEQFLAKVKQKKTEK